MEHSRRTGSWGERVKGQVRGFRKNDGEKNSMTEETKS
jgi:hypothetical protein